MDTTRVTTIALAKKVDFHYLKCLILTSIFGELGSMTYIYFGVKHWNTHAYYPKIHTMALMHYRTILMDHGI